MGMMQSFRDLGIAEKIRKELIMRASGWREKRQAARKHYLQQANV